MYLVNRIISLMLAILDTIYLFAFSPPNIRLSASLACHLGLGRLAIHARMYILVRCFFILWIRLYALLEKEHWVACFANPGRFLLLHTFSHATCPCGFNKDVFASRRTMRSNARSPSQMKRASQRIAAPC